MGAKNHALVMPDADPENVTNSLVGAAFGAGGQRCMALSVAVFVGESQKWIPDLVKKVKTLKLGSGLENLDLGPVISKEAKVKIDRIVSNSKNVILDGSNYVHPKYPNGNFVKPSIIDHVTADMECYQEEIFGPVLCIMRADSYEEALKIINDSKFGNGTCVYTRSGAVARNF